MPGIVLVALQPQCQPQMQKIPSNNHQTGRQRCQFLNCHMQRTILSQVILPLPPQAYPHVLSPHWMCCMLTHSFPFSSSFSFLFNKKGSKRKIASSDDCNGYQPGTRKLHSYFRKTQQWVLTLFHLWQNGLNNHPFQKTETKHIFRGDSLGMKTNTSTSRWIDSLGLCLWWWGSTSLRVMTPTPYVSH